MPNGPLIVTWPGGIGNPMDQTIPTSGGKRKNRKSRKTRKGTRKSRRGMSACTGARRCWSRKRRNY